MKSPTSYVSASELAEYIYCECCWWDKKDGLQKETEAMRLGTIEHRGVQRHLLHILTVRNAALFIICIGVLLLLLVVVLNIFSSL